jgi:ferredoxin
VFDDIGHGRKAAMPIDNPRGFRVVIHPEKCVGAGHCVAHASDVFAQDEDEGLILLKEAAPSPDRISAVREAASLCPVSAIEINE